MLTIFNTLGRKKQGFEPLRAGEVSMYTCGPTVYNYAHIGNLRAYISADILKRWLEIGHEYTVKWVLNITDVDDKTIRGSLKKYPQLAPREALQKFTSFYEEAFFSDMKSLGIKKSSFYATPRATSYIQEMQDLIQKISKKGFAKIIDGSVFFDVKKWDKANSYGKLLPLDLSQLRSGTRTLADEIEKDEMADFALWKGKKESEPFWEFSLNGQNLPGRPGWHIECSAMEKEILTLPFDIHTGGVDLIFPHHEDEVAQSCCGYSCEPTRYWFHNEHLLVDGKKMSKSQGNFYVLSDLLEKGYSPESLRFFLATSHYRSRINCTHDAIVSAESVLKKIANFLREISRGEGGEDCLRKEFLSLLEEEKRDFREAMDDDLNTPVAIASVHVFLSRISSLSPFSIMEQKQIEDFFSFVGEVFGVSFFPKDMAIPQDVIDLARSREEARKKNNWSESDRIRDEILARGFLLRDEKDGFHICPK